MNAYASYTGTRRNLAALRRHDWRILVSPGRRSVNLDGFRYALDNGAWSAYQAGSSWEPAPFVDLFARLGHGADFAVVPDIVAGGLASLRLSESWIGKLAGAVLLLLAVQDGMQGADVRPLLGPGVGVFVGGSTEWKLTTMAGWAALARERGTYCHVGRVNTARRIQMCALAGAHSFDGTSASRYAVTLPALDKARRQTAWIM